MTDQPTLLGRDDLLAAAATFEVRSRVVLDKFITLGGRRFDAVEVRLLLEHVSDREDVFNRPLCEVLAKLNVLQGGTGKPIWLSHVREGENFDLLRDMLDDLLSRIKE